MVGRKTKSAMLQHMLALRGLLPIHNQVRLWSCSRFPGRHVAIIDCEVQTAAAVPLATTTSTQQQGSWQLPGTDRRHFGALLCGRVFAPFSSVLCYFVADIGGQKAVAKWLALQATQNQTSDINYGPRILLVVETVSNSFDEVSSEQRFLDLLLKCMRELKVYEEDGQIQQDINRHFENVRVLGLRSSMTFSQRAKALKSRLSVMCEQHSQSHEVVERFTLGHVETLSGQILEHVCLQPNIPFSFAIATRPEGFSVKEFEGCLKDCLSQVPSQAWLWPLVAPLVGSALLLSCYPPRSHFFEPRFLFNGIFSSACKSAIAEYTDCENIQRKFLDAVLVKFESAYDLFIATSILASKMHKTNLELLHTELVNFKSNRSCFCCFMRKPEKVLICGHAFCDVCIRIYGKRSCSEKNTFQLAECILCGTKHSNSVFRFVPPTAGVRVLSLDRGGIRGVIPLVFLSHLQEELSGFSCPVRDYFDFVCGTSAGGLVVLGMFLLQWSTADCLQRFEEIARKTFNSYKEGSTIFAKALQLLLAYIEDGRYSLSAIEEAFHVTFNSQVKMFNPLRNDTKVAVTATTTENSAPCLFTNYNGQSRPENIGYNVLRAENPQNDVSVTDAACSTSAAPWFFKPHVIQTVGVFQDGGLQHNNPASIAKWELPFLWPKKPEPDFSLSLGTGTSLPTSSTKATKERFYVRLFKSFMRTLDGEDAWKRFINSLPLGSRDRYYRLNIHLPGEEPQLDDVLQVAGLKKQTTQWIQRERPISAVVDAMIASIFYFELDEMPVFAPSGFHCSGRISCRLDLPQSGRRNLYQRLHQTNSWFVIQGHPVACVDEISNCVPPYQRQITFTVGSLDELLAISIRGLTATSKPISGFPTTVQNLIDAQQLYSPFGTTSHIIFEKRLPVVPAKRPADDEREQTGKRILKG